jgi:alanine dehydrogenase
MLTIGILREGKNPPDARVPLSPRQCADIQSTLSLRFRVQPSGVRAFSDAEYAEAGIALQEDLSGCDVLLGVKEVPPEQLIPGKTYMFFSHTIKKQVHNRVLLQEVLRKQIRLIDYEMLTAEGGGRLVAFGYYAGIVGAHNGLWAYGQRTGQFSLPRLYRCLNYQEAVDGYSHLALPPLRIVLTGSGRVASGAMQNLRDMGIRSVSPGEYLSRTFSEPVFVQLFPQDYVRSKTASAYFDKRHYYAHGSAYESVFHPFSACTDILINGIYYDKQAPMFFTREDMNRPDFRIQVIADISCDLYPDGSLPCTLRASTISDPVYGYDPATGREMPPYQSGQVDVMAIDNLPSELPRDASAFFGQQMLDHVLPALVGASSTDVLDRATIADGGHLTGGYQYLQEWVSEG